MFILELVGNIKRINLASHMVVILLRSQLLQNYLTKFSNEEKQDILLWRNTL